MGDKQQAHVVFFLDLLQQSEQLCLDSDVERGGFEAISKLGAVDSTAAIKARCNMPPDNWWG